MNLNDRKCFAIRSNELVAANYDFALEIIAFVSYTQLFQFLCSTTE